jgi:TRAP-type C4-dicarboxylate transport system permease small subunit
MADETRSQLRSLGIMLTRCETVLVAIAALATAVMTLLTSFDAFSRYLLNRPILGAYEITEKYLVVAAIFLGLSYAYRGGAFIRVTFLVDRLPQPAKLVANSFAYLVSLGFCLVFLWATAQQALRTLSDATTLSTLPVPVGPAYCLVPLGFLAMTVLMLIDLPRVKRGNAFLFAQDEPTL